MRYNEFKLNEGFKEVQLKFSQEADPTKVASAFDTFKRLVSANRISGQERNIDWWGKQGWAAFIEYVTAIDERPSEAEQKSRTKKGNSHVIEETAEWLIVVPLDKDASCFHGKKSDWCTTKPTQAHFESYFRDYGVTLIYFFRQSDGAMWAMAVYPHANDDDQKAEYFDQQDNSLEAEDFEEQTELDSEKYIELVGGKTDVGQKATVNRDIMKTDFNTLTGYIKKLEQMSKPRRSAKIETLLLKVKDPTLIGDYLRTLYNYSGPVEVDQQVQSLVANSATSAIKFLNNVTVKTVKILGRQKELRYTMKHLLHPSKEALEYIANTGRLAVAYARYVIEGQWPPGEAAIITDAQSAFNYTREVINKGDFWGEQVRWPPGEAAIAQDAKTAYMYADQIIKGPWPPGEAAIITDAQSAFNYARYVIDKGKLNNDRVRWPPGEAAIASDAETAYRYAREVIKGRFPPGEAVIASDVDTSYKYVVGIIKGPWPPGEAAIAEDAETAYKYAREVIEGKWPAGEAAIAKKSNTAYLYARYIIKGPWPPGEAAIATESTAAYAYARDVIKGKWPPGEAAIAKYSHFERAYIDFLNTLRTD